MLYPRKDEPIVINYDPINCRVTANSEVETLKKKIDSDSTEKTTLITELESSRSQVEKSQQEIKNTEKELSQLNKTLEGIKEEKEKLQTQSEISFCAQNEDIAIRWFS